MNHIAHWNVPYAMSQSLLFLMCLAGLEWPNQNSNSPNDSVVQLSMTVEWMLEIMTSRSMAFPWMILTHSESGNSGSPLALNKLHFMILMSMVWFWISLQVSSWLGISECELLSFSCDLSMPHFSKFCDQNFKLQFLTHFLTDFLKT